jgi:hypothetical protein
MKIIAFVVRASEVKKILTHVGLPTESLRVHPARGLPQSKLWDHAIAREWGVDATFPDAVEQDQSLQWQERVNS